MLRNNVSRHYGHIGTPKRHQKVAYCPHCSKGGLVFVKDVKAHVCMACGYTRYLESPSSLGAAAAPSTAAPISAGIQSIDGLDDKNATPRTSGRAFKSLGDPRKHVMKKNNNSRRMINGLEVDEETAQFWIQI